MPHDQSPLTLLSHRFLSFSCDASRDTKAEGPLSLNTQHTISQHTEEALRWLVELEVAFSPSEEDNPSPYTGKIIVQGHFLVNEEFKKDHEDKENFHEALVRVTGSSMLYGAAREMLANFTARSTHGTLSLPSISFQENKEKVTNTNAQASSK